MNDRVKKAIKEGQIHAGNISFAKLREIAGQDYGIIVWNQLGRGTNILCTQEQLNQYLYSYGPMTKYQWNHFLKQVEIPEGRVRIIDYGCGQGLADALLFDFKGRDFLNRVESVVLIEPSKIALSRASAVLECYLNEVTIDSNRADLVTIHKKLDDLTLDELGSIEGINNIHIFSNVLDIPNFNHFNLFHKILQNNGLHCILAVSHSRSFHGGDDRFKELQKQINDEKYASRIRVLKSQIDDKLKYNNKTNLISWELHVEVFNGPV